MDTEFKSRDDKAIEWLALQLLEKQMEKYLAVIVDELTPAYKIFLEKMGSQTRAVFTGLLGFGRPITAKELAIECGIDINQASAYLNRFFERDWVVKITDQKPSRFEAKDPFGYVICLRPGIEVYWRIRRKGRNELEKLSLVAFQQ